MAKRVKGWLLKDIYGKLFFRIYDPKNKRIFKDYQIRSFDMEVEIIDRFSKIYDTPVLDKEGNLNYDGYIDYNDRVLGKAAPVLIKGEVNVLRKSKAKKKVAKGQKPTDKKGRNS